MEKPSLQWNAENTGNTKQNKLNNEEHSTMPTECERCANHMNLEDVNLKEESNDMFLNENWMMQWITCSQCRKQLV